ncbi:hypothetical protein [Terriglobus sp.]|uniref:hypothetical protein n=1 Tax=Terriglobus sp. TaxID=1889013 RepID=UPI003B00AFB0
MAQNSLQQATLQPSANTVAGDETAASAPSNSIASALQQLAGQAAIIFTGTVATVVADANGGAQVKFIVEQGVRGVASGTGYTMHASPWAGGAERFYPGERALFLLTAPSASGYSAPVMGERGVAPLSGDALVGNLDLRWVATDVQRGAQAQDGRSAASAQVRSAAVSAGMEPANAAIKPAQNAGPVADPASTSAMPDVHAIDRDLVLDLLRTNGVIAGQTR